MDCVSGVALGAAVSSLLVILKRDGNDRNIRQQQQDQHAQSYLSEEISLSYAERSRQSSSVPHPEWSRASSNGPRAELSRQSSCFADTDELQSCPDPEGRRSGTDSMQRVASDDNLSTPCIGLSMAEARRRIEAAAANSKEKTPSEVLAELQRGNARFWTGNAKRPEKNAFDRRSLIMQQFPCVAVLGCSDSRVPTEIVFDQGLGDMFVVRVAGNCLDTSTSASLEYAVHHLKVKVLLVMGHEGCGAVKAAGLPMEQIEQESASLARILKGMKQGLDEDRLSHIIDEKAHDREAVVTNVTRQIEQLTEDEAMMQKVREQELIIIGAFYEISSGIVDFFPEVSNASMPSKGASSQLDMSSLSKNGQCAGA